MNDKTLYTLEFHKVRERLASHASFSLGKSLALELAPSTNITIVRRNQRITSEAARLLSLRPDASVGPARDVRELTRRAELGSILDPAEILMVQDTLRAGRNLRGLIVRTSEQKGELETLVFIADGITILQKVESEIERCINEEGAVLDSASPALGKIRANMRTAHNRLMAKLQQIISSETYARALQEPLIMQRDGRYVVPVKADFKGQLRGIVHDQSNSGATLFVEPLAVVELANAWRQQQLEEQQEIERILRELGALIGAHGEQIRTNVEIIGDLDLALAKARYSYAINGMEPSLVEPHPKGPDPARPADNRERRRDPVPAQQQQQNTSPVQSAGTRQQNPPQERGMLFRNARHPLLTGSVVPITIELGTRFRMLVITGPNTGGKTVALKTAGLLTLMAQAGLHLPVDHGSRAVVFKKIFADIGDEQSIEQSLSTFSSHMTNIISILKEADRDSLVLLDELGAGTDPQEGSALARAIITYILEFGPMAICTTHYSELKAFAFNTRGVENASVEFDVNTLSPTYRLMIGVPGRSNALAIASRLGLRQNIIDRAKSFIDPEAQNVEDLFENIRTEREVAQQERGTAERARRELDRRQAELDRRLAEVEEIKARAAEDARAETEREMQGIRDEMRRLRSRVEAGMAATSGEDITRQWVREAQARAEELDREVKARTAQQRNNQARRRPQRGVEAGEEQKPHVLAPGDSVFVQSLGADGDVISAPDSSGQIEVQVGAFKMRVPVTGVVLRRTASVAREQAAAASASKYTPAPPPSDAPPLEYDFRGWRAEEAIEEIDHRLDQAALAGMPFIRIIHGKGTGALRKAMRDYLKSHPLVKTMEPGKVEEGGDGVTIVKL